MSDHSAYPLPDDSEGNAVRAKWLSNGTLWRCVDVEKDLWEQAVWVEGNMAGGFTKDRVVRRSELEEDAAP